ncbi:hypothetical protein [Oleidesulfovibrio alaskensis]
MVVHIFLYIFQCFISESLNIDMPILFRNNARMKNAVEDFRLARGLTYAAVGRTAGFTRATVLKHCRGELAISGEAALRYHLRLGIPLKDLRPDLFAADSDKAA